MFRVGFIHLNGCCRGMGQQAASVQPHPLFLAPPPTRKQKLTMSTTLAITRMKMANMAQVFLAQRVRSIHDEKATSFLGNA